MANWHSVLKDWGKMEGVSVDPGQMLKVQQATTAWVAQRRRMQQEEEPGLNNEESKASKKRRRKEEVTQRVLSERDLEKGPPV